MNIPKPVLYASVVGTIGGAIVLLKDGIRGAQYKGDEKAFGRTIIVTGATSGLGLETAKELAVRGGRVLMACRDMEKCEKVRQEIIEKSFNKNVHCKKLDLASLKSVRDFADDILKNEKRLDILINNAGVMCIPERKLSEAGFEMHLAVNHLGPFLLTNLLLPKLKESAPSRIINVTSVAHKRGLIDFTDLNAVHHYRKEDRYHMTKLANILFTRELAKQLAGTGVTSYAVNPGISMTNIGRHTPMGSSASAGFFAKPLLRIFLKEASDGMQSILYCALEPSISSESGEYYEECQKSLASERAHNDQVAKRLWMVSDRWTGLSQPPSQQSSS